MTLNNKQTIYREIVLGTLVYAVVLGFYNDYTSFLYTKSYSTTFLVALVLEILTFATLLLKQRVVSHFKQRSESWAKAAMVFVVWLILFLSKFVFLAALDFVFGSNVEISGFVGLLAIIITMTIAKGLIDYVFKKLGD